MSKLLPLLSRLPSTALLGLCLTLVVSACALDEPLDEDMLELRDGPGEHVFLVCDGEPPPEPQAHRQLLLHRAGPAWDALVEESPELQGASPEQRMAVDQATISALEAIGRDLQLSTPLGGCIVDCSTQLPGPGMEDHLCLAEFEPTPDTAQAVNELVHAFEMINLENPICFSLRATAKYLSNLYGSLVMSDCINCSADQIRDRNLAADEVMAALRELARTATMLGCAPPSGWSTW